MEHSYTEKDLFEGVKENNPTKVQEILKAGVNVNAKNSHGAASLHEAALFNRGTKIVEALIGAGANIKAQDNDGFTPLHMACRSAKGLRASAKVLHMLIDGGADIHAKTVEGRTPLHHTYRADFIKILLQYGAKVDEQDNRGETRLHWACRDNAIEALKILIESGADVKKSSYENPFTSVGYAIQGKNDFQFESDRFKRYELKIQHDEIMLTLLSHEASINYNNPAQANYFDKLSPSLFDCGNSYQKLQAWITMFNTCINSSNNVDHTSIIQSVLTALKNAWSKININKLETLDDFKKIGDISEIIIKLENVTRSLDHHAYICPGEEMRKEMDKLIPSLEKSINELKSYKTNLILNHIKSEDQTSEFKGRIKFYTSGSNSFKDHEFLKDFIGYYPQDDEAINQIPILHEKIKVMHLGNTSTTAEEFSESH